MTSQPRVNWTRLIIGGLVASWICFATDGLMHNQLLEADWARLFEARGTAMTLAQAASADSQRQDAARAEAKSWRTRAGDAAWSQTDLFDTVAPRLEGFGEPTRFSF